VQWPSHDSKKAAVLLLKGVMFNKPFNFLIDSGAEKSVFPSSLVPPAIVFPTSSNLVGVDGTPLKVFGHFQAKIGVKSLRREFLVNFVATDTRPILGADFLTTYGLKLDMKKRKLTDPLTNIETDLVPSSEPQPTVRVAEEVKSDCFVEKHFPSLLSAPDYFSLPSKVDSVHAIETTGQPVFSKARQLSPVKFEAAKAEFDLLLQAGIIRPSNSPWASPLHMVKKGDGSWRPCGDYRRLNTVTVPDRYAIPNIQTVHNKMEGANIFSRLDLVKAYHFIPMRESDICKTAICTPFGTYEYTRMPFGLRNASSTFQRFIDNLLRDIPFVVTYIDDILIFSQSQEEHQQHLLRVLERLNTANLRINRKKSDLFKNKINFLGFEFSSTGIKPMPERVQALIDLPPPGDQKTLQRYIGMFAFYQRCLPHFSDIIKPLRELLRAPKFCWMEDHNEAFRQLKTSVKEAVELNFPSSKAQFTITADASSYALGACLHQVVNGVSSPLGFFSRKMSDVEQRYSTFDRELLAVFCAVKRWKEFVIGSHLTIFTDHKPLIGAINSGKPRISDRQQRQLSFINEVTTDVVHIAGRDNIVADTLSRAEKVSTISSNNDPMDLISICKAQSNSDIDFSAYKAFDIGDSNTLYCETSSPNPRPYLPPTHRKAVFSFFHNLSHAGIKASTKLVGSRYYWPTLKPDVKTWVGECLLCQESKVDKHAHRPLDSLPCPTQRFCFVHLDIVGPLSQDEDRTNPKYLLTMIDSYTRWLEVFPLSDISAHSVSRAFLFCWVARFGPPVTLISDRGKQFCCELLSNITNALGINHIRSSAYNPKANGTIERVHRCLKSALIARGGNWLQELPMVLMGLRCNPSDDGSSPYSRVFGEQPILPRVVVDSGTVDDINRRLQGLTWKYNVPRSREVKANHVNEKLMKSDFVWVRLDRVKKPLEAPYQGPYKVLQRNNTTFTLEMRGAPATVSIERLKPATIANSKEETCNPAPPPDDDANSQVTPNVCDGPAEAKSRSGRRIKFAKEDDYVYF